MKKDNNKRAINFVVDNYINEIKEQAQKLIQAYELEMNM